MTTTTITCAGINDRAPHDLEANADNFAGWALDPNRKTVRCRDCDREYRRTRKGNAAGRKISRAAADVMPTFDGDLVPEGEVTRSHKYIADPKLLRLFKVVVSNTIDRGAAPANLMFLGPSGSGKTDGAAFLAASVGLPFTKVDAASMTDPEAWFGTREVIVQDGVSVTHYEPSDLVRALQAPGVIFIDEFNRVDDEHRNVWLPLTDGTGRVTNPLTGEVVERHPHCFIIMAGNRGLQFTGTSAVDPAFMTRALVVEFSYLTEDQEQQVLIDATGCDADTAFVFARFGSESRGKAMADPDFDPISTRQLMKAAELVAGGLDRDLAAEFTVLNAASAEGDTASVRTELQAIWNGVRVARPPKREAAESGSQADPDTGTSMWTCPTHGVARTVPAGVSKAGNPYPAFRACTVRGCDLTEDRAKRAAAPANTVCPQCAAPQPAGRVTLCHRCGAAL